MMMRKREQVENSSFLPSAISQPREEVRVKQNIENCEMKIDGENHFSEYSTPYLASICFPSLFQMAKQTPLTLEIEQKFLNLKLNVLH